MGREISRNRLSGMRSFASSGELTNPRHFYLALLGTQQKCLRTFP